MIHDAPGVKANPIGVKLGVGVGRMPDVSVGRGVRVAVGDGVAVLVGVRVGVFVGGRGVGVFVKLGVGEGVKLLVDVGGRGVGVIVALARCGVGLLVFRVCVTAVGMDACASEGVSVAVFSGVIFVGVRATVGIACCVRLLVSSTVVEVLISFSVTAVVEVLVSFTIAAVAGVFVLFTIVAGIVGMSVATMAEATTATEVATSVSSVILLVIVAVAVASGVFDSDKMMANVIANARMPTAAMATMTSFPRSRCIY
jgi:hypothetical protein